MSCLCSFVAGLSTFLPWRVSPRAKILLFRLQKPNLDWLLEQLKLRGNLLALVRESTHCSTPMQIILICVSAFLLLATLLPLIQREAWWIRIFDFPRLQVMVVALATLLIYVLCCDSGSMWDDLVVASQSGIVLFQLSRMVPYTVIGKPQVKPSQEEPKARVSMLVANVRKKNQNTQPLQQLVYEKRPDLVLLLEPDHHWEEQLRALEEQYPHQVKEPLENTYGMLLYSRFPLYRHKIHHLTHEGVPAFECELDAGLELPLKLWCLHPLPPRPGQDTDNRDAELVMVGKRVKDLQQPVMVAGDLNDVAWSHTTRLFQRISHLLDPRRGRGFYNTYHAHIPLFRWPLDHIFHSDHFHLYNMERLQSIGSDHFPVFIHLAYEPDHKEEQEKPQKDPGDEQEAQRKIEQTQE